MDDVETEARVPDRKKMARRRTNQMKQQKVPLRPWTLAGAWPWRQQTRQPSPVSYRIVEECSTNALQPCKKALLGFASKRARAVVRRN